MMVKRNNFHTDFQLNGNSFSSVNELLRYAESISETTYQFLKEWFSESDFVIVQTSGSTGTPKPIQLQKEFMVNSAFTTGTYFGLAQKTSALLCLPTAYIAGKMMLVRALVLGWHLDHVPSNTAPLQNIEKTYDFSAMVPMQVENSIGELSRIKKLLVGGGIVSAKLQMSLQGVSTDVFATYGMTETITHIAVQPLNNIKDIPSRISSSLNTSATQNSLYTTLPNITISKDVNDCLVIEAPNLTEEIVFTNDVVQLISDRQFIWLGRFDNVINSGGVKLHPEIIEQKLSKLIKNRFFVAGIPDEKLGQKLILCIEGAGDEGLLKKLRSSTLLSKFEIPKEVFFADAFVETATKKIQRTKTLNLIIPQ
jgi:O-succinylbenzoic acid--CoA ligase